MRYSVTLSYDGSAYNGWQFQNNAASIQESLQSALSTVLKHPVAVTGAGRTDSKVNAIGYTAHFDWNGLQVIDTAQLVCKLNAILPGNIIVHGIYPEKENFHARFDAVLREYTYFIHRKKDPFMEKYSFLCTYRLDVEAMNKAAALLLGTHDFSSFEKTGSNNKTSICTVKEAAWTAYTPVHAELMGYPASEGDYLYFRISADRFLRNMVRAVVGSLIDVGRGRHEPEWIEWLIGQGTRSDAGESVPGNALFLSRVIYPQE